MKHNHIKLYATLVCAHVEPGPRWFNIEVSARTVSNASKLASEAVARKCRVSLANVDVFKIELLKSTDWTSERVYKYR